MSKFNKALISQDSSAEYRKHEGLNQSHLKSFHNSPRAFYEAMVSKVQSLDKPEAFRIGGAVDCLLTTPEEFEDSYAIVEVPRPSGLMEKFVMAYAFQILALEKNYVELTDEEKETIFNSAYEQSGYKISKTRVQLQFTNDFQVTKFLEVLVNSKGKVILTTEDMLIINKVVNAFNKCAHVREVLMLDADSSERDLLTQVAIYWNDETSGILCKGLLDYVVVDHKNKIIKPFDLKTTISYIGAFPASFVKFGYYIQAAWYLSGLMQQMWVKDLLDKGYKLDDFKFIVVEKAFDNSVGIFKTPAKIIEETWNGNVTSEKGERQTIMEMNGVKAVTTCLKGTLEQIKYHNETNNWNLTMEAAANNGLIHLANDFNVQPDDMLPTSA